MSADDETQGIANAKATRDLVLSQALRLAKRTIEHVDEHAPAGLSFVALDEQIPAGGYTWELTAKYAPGNTFLMIEGEPQQALPPEIRAAHDAGVYADMDDLAAAMGGKSAAFRFQVPRSWVELALEAADVRSLGDLMAQ